ncbi:MAG: hypothetical protein NVS3B23_02090 [Candidatus Saccharimonadales bacterium]
MPTEKPFLLFIGGADRRRKLIDLVTAFNHLRAQGVQINLVLAGDSMQGPYNISTEETQAAFLHSSYLQDIIFMGFVNDKQRDWLYKNALAYVFPSKYEGFGLPVLEALIHGTPVISYPNKATVEVAGNTPFYAYNAFDIQNKTAEILNLSQADLEKKKRINVAAAKNYSWKITSLKIISNMENNKN